MRAARFGVSPTTPRSRLAVADQITDHHQPGGDADAGFEPGMRLQPSDPLGEREAGAHRALGVVLMRLGIAEIAQHAVTATSSAAAA
jgi:hypothetical protein